MIWVVRSEILKKDWKLRHLAFVVKDIDNAVSYYESLGLVGAVGPELSWHCLTGVDQKCGLPK